MRIGIGLIPFVWSIPTLLGALGVLAVGMGFNNPSLTSMVSKLADPDDQGGILGLASSIASLGRVVGPAWGGYLYDAYGMTTPYVSAAGLMMIAFFVSFIGLRNVRAGDTRGRDMKPAFIHAANPGPMTGDGNWTYLIGGSRPVLIDAGVGHASHLDAIARRRAVGPVACRRHPRAQRSHHRRAGDPRALAGGDLLEASVAGARSAAAVGAPGRWRDRADR